MNRQTTDGWMDEWMGRQIDRKNHIQKPYRKLYSGILSIGDFPWLLIEVLTMFYNLELTLMKDDYKEKCVK